MNVRKLAPFLLVITIFLAATYPYKAKKVIFFGDSITQAGVNPGGYIVKMDSIIKAAGLSDQYQLIGAGIGGNKIYDLYLRMEQDVLAKSPDVVVVYIGVNDVWHKTSSGTGTDYDKFGRFYDAVVKKLQAAGIKVILATPAVIGERHDNSNAQDGDLNHYSNWIRKYASDNKLQLVDLRNSFQTYSKANNPKNDERGILTTDRVHLNAAGNLLVAEEMWKAIKEVK
jgi:lysophospholipase L1-like esterase